MCLIAVAKNRSAIPLEHLTQAQRRNNDGWGIMYADEGRVIALRGMGKAEFDSAWAGCPDDRGIAVHFRFATKGPKDLANCHPFRVLDVADGQDIFVMHNGPQIASDCHGDKRRSDTLEFVQDLVSPMLRGKPRFVRTAAFRRIMENMIGTEKLVFLEGCGKWHWANYAQGDVIDGVWYSNTYSIEAPYSWRGAKQKSISEGTARPGVYLSDGLKEYMGISDDEAEANAAHWGQYDTNGSRWLYPDELANRAGCPFDPAKRGFVKTASGLWETPKGAHTWNYTARKWTPVVTAANATSAATPLVPTPVVAVTKLCPEDGMICDCDGGECIASPFSIAALEADLQWKPENLRKLSESELADLVWKDSERAADVIRELVR